MTWIEELQARGQSSISRSMLNIYRSFQAQAAEQYAQRGYAGLRLAHTLLLASLDPNGMRIVELAERMGTTKQFAGRLVQELSERGLLERAADPSDRRALLVRATAAGWEFLAAACDVREEIEARYQSQLGPELFTAFTTALERLGAHSTADAADDLL